MTCPPLLVVGASAGGIEALTQLVAGLSTDLAAAVLVTVHTGGREHSNLPQILSRSGRLPAEHARHGMALRPGRIVVAPPDRHMLATCGGLVLSAGPRVNRQRPAVDVMFAAAARMCDGRVVAAVLSGVLDDGAVGAALVHRSGGQVAVQDPADALFGAMPRAALRAVPSARSAPAGGLGTLLATMVHHPFPERGDEPMPQVPPPNRDDPAMADSADPAFLRPDEAALTRVTCPDCGGALAQVDLAHIRYFRCHVGHQFGPLTLEAAMRERAEATLWAAVAALEEHAATARHVEQQDDPPRASDLGAAAERSAELARAVSARLDGETGR